MSTGTISTGKAGPEEAKIIREMIRHEDVLLTARVTWFCTVQGFLFASLAFAWEKDGARPLVYIIAVMGVVIAFSLYFSVRAALLAIERQRNWWEENRVDGYCGPDIIGRRPDQRSVRILRPSVVLPFAFVVAWIAVTVVQVLRSG